MHGLRFLWAPVAGLYGAVVWLRNVAYDRGWFSVYEPDGPVICIGNLSTGGTGKTPHVIHLAQHLGKRYKVGIISRGYGRKSRGFYWVDASGNWEHFGDEPMEIARAVPAARVAVCENRALGIQRLFQEACVEVILMDDGFQHRSVRAGFYLLLTSYHRPYFRDRIFPMGDLREFKSGVRRAHHLIITKTPAGASWMSFPDFPIPNSHSSSRNLPPVRLIPPEEPSQEGKPKEFVAVTAIARGEKFVEALQPELRILAHLSWRDHHAFSRSDVDAIQKTALAQGVPVITTMKDFIRLREVWQPVQDIELWVSAQVLEPLSDELYKAIDHYVTTTKRS